MPESRTKSAPETFEPMISMEDWTDRPTPAISVASIGYEGDLDVEEVGPEDFEPETLLGYHRSMVLARRLDEKMLNLLKQGRGFTNLIEKKSSSIS